MPEHIRMDDKAPIVEDETKHRRWGFGLREITIGLIAIFLLVACIVFVCLYAREKAEEGVVPTTSKLVAGGSNGNGGTSNTSNVIDKNNNSSSIPDGNDKGVPLRLEDKYCTTKECLETATRSIKLMNMSVDPCENFYEFACGNYKTDHPYINRVSARTTQNDIKDLNDDRLLTIIERPPSSTDDSNYEKKLSDFFNSCKNDYNRQKKQGKPFLEKIVQLLGGWKLIGTWNESKFDFNEALKKVQTDLWVDAFYSTSVVIDRAQHKNRIIEIRNGGLGKWMAPNRYTEPRFQQYRKDYKMFMKRIAFLLFRDAEVKNVTEQEKEARLAQFVNDTMTVELGIAKALMSTDSFALGTTYSETNRISISDLNKETGSVIDWEVQLPYMYGDAGVNGDTKVSLQSKGYYRNVSDFINSLPDVDRKRILHNYLIWRCAERYAQDLAYDYIHANRLLFIHTHGYSNFMGFKYYCTQEIRHYMKDALSALYVEEHFAKEGKDKVVAITSNLKKGLQSMLDKTQWMDNVTREYAKDKLDRVTFKMGYPDWMDNKTYINNLYSNFTVMKSDYLGSLLNANQFLRARQIKDLKFGEDKSEWLYGPYETMIYVNWIWNEIYAPAAILQSPIYDKDDPHFTTFGSLGVMLARYLHHIIDDWGQHYDKMGASMGQSSWWSSWSLQAYLSVHTCVRQVYMFADQTVKLNSGRTLHFAINIERYEPVAIATTSAIRLTLKSYVDWLDERGEKPEKMLPGLNLTSADQMIFLSYAQTHCSNRDSASKAYMIRQGEVLDETRVNMALGQLQEFSNAFKCRPSSRMNQGRKCDYY